MRPPAQIEAEDETDITDIQSVDTPVSKPAVDEVSDNINESEEVLATDMQAVVASDDEYISANTSDQAENSVELIAAQKDEISSGSEQVADEKIPERRNPEAVNL
ncbi:hypothetical protein [Niabella ginsengisoli]|uniref:Uncharacterized protein n=1 Tax=Niabella ginsengisoli TaxID=522298 RepID=A0ABS9SNE6_9BACT|nr:hypothetical protein [Niabella ginsengisoli]MCH5599895.1 hypothetical protein [Niabella ginsengisoli]